MTGLPRPDRWREVRPAAYAALLSVARDLDEVVVVDTGFGLADAPVDPYAPAPDRDDLTRVTLEQADVVVVVASADPVGLARLALALADLGTLDPDLRPLVVVNRMRSSLGWSEREVSALVGRVDPRVPVVFLPEDRPAADRALVTGRTLVEGGDGPLRRAVAALARTIEGLQTVSSR